MGVETVTILHQSRNRSNALQILRFCAVGVAALLAFAGCEGPTGPAGPQGPPGPQGITKMVVSAILDADGEAVVALPTTVGTVIAQPPAVTCYTTSSVGTGVWLHVADGFTVDAPYCAVTFVGGGWRVEMAQGVPGWVAAWVVVY